MTTEFRVVVEGGKVRKVSLARSHIVGAPWVPNGDGLCGAANPRIAVAAYAGARAWPVREILAPGELSAEERVAVERARCAAVCREVADAHAADYGGEYGAALECAAAIMRGPEERRFHLQLADGCGGWVPASEHGTLDLYATARDAWDVARAMYPDTEHLSQMCRVVERGAVTP